MNDHQVEFANAVSQRMGTIIPIVDVNQLQATILNYDDIVASMPLGMKSNNGRFNKELEKVVKEIF